MTIIQPAYILLVVKGGAILSEVGNNIRKAREALGWTREELARRMGYKSKTTVNKVEKGVKMCIERITYTRPKMVKKGTNGRWTTGNLFTLDVKMRV